MLFPVSGPLLSWHYFPKGFLSLDPMHARSINLSDQSPAARYYALSSLVQCPLLFQVFAYLQHSQDRDARVQPSPVDDKKKGVKKPKRNT